MSLEKANSTMMTHVEVRKANEKLFCVPIFVFHPFLGAFPQLFYFHQFLFVSHKNHAKGNNRYLSSTLQHIKLIRFFRILSRDKMCNLMCLMMKGARKTRKKEAEKTEWVDDRRLRRKVFQLIFGEQVMRRREKGEENQ
jgi:hypothetical protein